jgi:hypothetical protein
MQMSDTQPAVKHYFVDEAGDLVLFSGDGNVLIGSEGCSRYFVVGLLDVPDAAALAVDLDKLRADLLADPYFKDVPSMQPDAKKNRALFSCEGRFARSPPRGVQVVAAASHPFFRRHP